MIYLVFVKKSTNRIQPFNDIGKNLNVKNAAFDKVSVSPILLPLWSINTHCLKKLVTSLLALLGLATACERLNYENADVRTAAEYEEGHIQGAINIDVKQENFIETAKATLPSDKIIAVY